MTGLLGALPPVGVVVVARVPRVDRWQRKPAQVLPSDLHLLGNFTAEGFGLRHRGLRMGLLNSLEHQDLRHFYGKLARTAEYSFDAAFGGLAVRFRKARDRYDDGVPLVPAVAFGTTGIHRFRKDDRSTHARVVRFEPGALGLAA